MEIGSARVHIIVAMAFYGAQDTKVYVVDHIDTNRQNNQDRKFTLAYKT